MAKKTHFIFGYSAAADVSHALKLLGSDDAVAKFPDDLNYGPIDSTEWSVRQRWFEEHVGFRDNDEIESLSKSFWQAASDNQVIPVVWVSRRCAWEYCGFLEYLRRLGEKPSLMIETTDTKGPDGKVFTGTASIPAEQIVSSGLLESAADLSPQWRANGQALWRSLRDQNAPLRVVDTSLSLASAPISFYDDMLLSFVGAEWTSMALVVGSGLCHIWDCGVSGGSDEFLFSRLYVLLQAGILQGRPDAGRHPRIRRVGV